MILVAKQSLVSIYMHHGNNHDHRPVSVLVQSTGALRYMIMTRLIDECCEIQKRLETAQSKSMSSITKRFTKLLLLGKLSQASKLINKNNHGPLPLNEDVKFQLLQKHPNASPANEAMILGPSPKIEEVIFESIDANLVSNVIKLINGSGGPTQIDGDQWKHMVCSNNFKSHQRSLCQAIATLTKHLCTEDCDPDHLKELLACRLIPLDKRPGIRPIGVGEVLHRIIGKCVTLTLKIDIEESVGGLQMCGGQQAGVEAAIHAMHDIYKNDDCEAMLLVDATNAFNSLNRKVALQNLKIICPNLAQYVENSYKQPTRLYISNGGGEYILSQEGTTQGDNIAMAFYAISTRPIIEELQKDVYYELEKDKFWQAWFADDASAAGNLSGILKWWNQLITIGPRYGYNPNPNKCVLITKNSEIQRKAQEMFSKFGMEITTTGMRHLGAVVGSTNFKAEYMQGLVKGWVDDVKLLANIAKSEPQCAYTAMTYAIQHRWKFAQRTIPDISAYMQELEFEIQHTLIPAMIGRDISDEERDIFALPVRLGGMGIPKPDEMSDLEYRASVKITQLLKESIIKKKTQTQLDAAEIKLIKTEVKKEKDLWLNTKFDSIYSHATPSTKRAIQNAKQKGASSWLTNLPLEWLGYALNKQEFKDSVYLRYNWNIESIPKYCGCGKSNSIDHSLSCKLGGYVIMRPEVESLRTSLASRTSSRTDFEVLGLEASSPRKLACPRLEDSTIFWKVKILWSG